MVQQYTGREGDSQQVKERRETLRHREGKLSVRHRREGDGDGREMARQGRKGNRETQGRERQRDTEKGGRQ